MKPGLPFIFIFLSLIGLFSCSKSKSIDGATLSFYTWNNVFSLDSSQYSFLTEHKINHLHVKVMEIGYIEGYPDKPEVKNHITIGYNNQAGQYFTDNKLTPVIFLENDMFYKLGKDKIPQLASLVKRALQIHTLDLIIEKEDIFPSRWDKLFFSLNTKQDHNDSLQKVYDRFLENIVSYEFDCDWTEKTRDNYFYFLQNIKDSLQAPIESTLRLHQYKFREKMGIPPVDRVNLMCYNMDAVKKMDTQNSIFEKEILFQYLKGQKAYPVKLNVAFPLFNWMVVFRNGTFLRLVPGEDLKDKQDQLEGTGSNQYRVKNSIYLNWSESLQEGDIIRLETVKVSDLKETYSEILENTEEKPEEIIFFDLQSAVTKESIHELEEIIPR